MDQISQRRTIASSKVKRERSEKEKHGKTEGRMKEGNRDCHPVLPYYIFLLL